METVTYEPGTSTLCQHACPKNETRHVVVSFVYEEPLPPTDYTDYVWTVSNVPADGPIIYKHI